MPFDGIASFDGVPIKVYKIINNKIINDLSYLSYSMFKKDNSEYKKRLAYLKQDIDRALEKKDEELFLELSKQYNIMLMEK